LRKPVSGFNGHARRDAADRNGEIAPVFELSDFPDYERRRIGEKHWRWIPADADVNRATAVQGSRERLAQFNPIGGNDHRQVWHRPHDGKVED
jgi:hypothetical protein